ALRGWEDRARLLERAARVSALVGGGQPGQLRVRPYRNAFQDAMDDDMDTPTAIQVLLQIAGELEGGRLDGATGAGTLVELGEVLGLRLRPD
ncbi:MAG: DALR domain-containing protein, partial [Dehalococcoidia bacterium]